MRIGKKCKFYHPNYYGIIKFNCWRKKTRLNAKFQNKTENKTENELYMIFSFQRKEEYLMKCMYFFMIVSRQLEVFRDLCKNLFFFPDKAFFLLIVLNFYFMMTVGS